jgi:hypothetical protein
MISLRKFGFRKAGSGCCLLLLLFVSSNCGAWELARSNNANANSGQNKGNSSNGDATLFYLDLANPNITQPIQAGEVEGAKFVEVEVTEVTNPKAYALSFEVRFKPRDSAMIYLGSFGLYPADNPGKFIVATQGKVKGEGAIVLTLVVSDKVERGDLVKVGIKKIRFVKT